MHHDVDAPTASQTIFHRIFQMIAPAEALSVPVSLSAALTTKAMKMENSVKELASFSRLSPSRMMRRCSGPPAAQADARSNLLTSQTVQSGWAKGLGKANFVR